MVRTSCAAVALLACINSAYAQACWAEWGTPARPLLRGDQCVENVSLADFSQRFCLAQKPTDRARSAAQCASSAPTRIGSEWLVNPVAARCVAMRPPGLAGQVTIVYYLGDEFEQNQESLRELCPGFGGRWEEAAR